MPLEGLVYVLHNCEHRQPSVKIGWSAKSVETRARRLDGTGSPGPFIELFSVRVLDAPLVERLLKERFADFKIRDRREFFRLAPRTAIAALIEVSAPYLAEQDDHSGPRVNVLPEMRARYGSLLHPALRSATIYADEGTVILACGFEGMGAELTDLSVIGGGPWDFDPDDIHGAAGDFLDQDPWSHAEGTPLFPEDVAGRIQGMFEDYLLEGATLLDYGYVGNEAEIGVFLDMVRASIDSAGDETEQSGA